MNLFDHECPKCSHKMTFLLTDGVHMVPPAGLEPALREETDFESVASTNSAKEAYPVDRGVSTMDAADTDWQMGAGQYHGLRRGRKEEKDVKEIRQLSVFDLREMVDELATETRWMAARLRALWTNVKLPFDWKASFYYDTRGYWYFQVEDTKAICNVTGESYPWKGRKWLISEHMTDGEIIQTMFKATMTAVEHEAREMFLYKDVAVFDPHYDLDKLAELRKRKDALKTRDTAA